jgi:hypothetical protein
MAIGRTFQESLQKALRLLRLAKRHGFSTPRSPGCVGITEPEAVVRGVRHALGMRPVFKTVDTCAAEFAAQTPYHYSTYDEENEVAPRRSARRADPRLGPNRIGQGIEFDYCCVHASFALRDAGYETVMVNCNPETVSTDYDTSDRLYFEPLTLEDVLEVVHAERHAGPIAGVIVQLGGQTPLGWPRRSRPRACRSSARHPRPSTSPRTAARSAACCTRRTCPRPSTARPTAPTRPSTSPGRSATRCSCVRRTCSAVAAWRSSTTTRRSSRLRRAGHHRQPGAPGARRPLPRRRDRDRRRRALRRHRHVCRRDHGAHRGGRHPLRRLGSARCRRSRSATASSSGCGSRPASSPRASGCGV